MTRVSSEIADKPVDANGAAHAAAVGQIADVNDYFALLKPRVMSLVIFTALVGLMVAPGTIHPWLGMVALLCIALGAGASGSLNMWYDADIDREMKRTSRRPIPRGTLNPGDALAFGLILAIGSVLMMGVLVNWVAAALLALTIGFYVFVYTMWLKRRTPQNIVIGGAAGAFPPMVGWAAVTGSVSLESLSLFLIIFMWTPPHFWALSLFRSDDYARAGVPMLPVVAGADETRKQILIYSLLLAPISLLPYFLQFAGVPYLIVALLSSTGFVLGAIKVFRTREGEAADRAAKELFKFSLLYLFLLFATLLVESLAGLSHTTLPWL